MLKENGISGRMSRPRCPYDNACSQSFFATIKKERSYQLYRSGATVGDGRTAAKLTEVLITDLEYAINLFK